MSAGGAENARPAEPERQARYRWVAGLAEGLRVLDAACGAGWGTALLAAAGAAAVGVDASPAAVAAARAAYGDMATFREGDIRELPFREAEFDVIVCFEALAHVREHERALDEMRRVLRPGGLAVVSSPNPGVYPAGNPLHLREATPEELRDMLTARFANVAVHRQQTYVASLLCDDVTLSDSDPAERLELEVRKSSGGPPGSELHAVAVASDGELPPAPAWLVLGRDPGHEEQRRVLEHWQERAIRAEARATALRRELGARRSL